MVNSIYHELTFSNGSNSFVVEEKDDKDEWRWAFKPLDSYHVFNKRKFWKCQQNYTGKISIK